MPVIEGYRFAVDLEDRGLSRSLKEIKNEAQALKNVMRANFAELKNGESTFSAYSQRIKDAKKSIDTYQVAIDKLKEKIDGWNAQQAKNINENDKLNRQIVRAQNTIARYTVAQENLKRQMDQDTLAMKRAETGIDALRKATQGITTSNKALVESFKQSGHYYAANRASAVGLKNESKALEAQLKAESEVTKQLKNAQSGLISKSNEIKSKIPTITAEIQKNKLAYEQLGKKVGELSLQYGAQSNRAELARKKQAEVKQKINESTQAYEKAKNQLRGLSDELGKNSSKLANQAEKTQKVSAQLNKLEKESRSLRNTKLGSFYSATSAKLGRFNATLKASTSNTRKWWQESKTGFATVGVALGGVTAGAAKAVSDAAKVEKQYIEVKNLIRTGGESVRASIKESNEMQRQGTKLSMEYGYAQKEIGVQYEELVKRGYSGTAALGSMNAMMQAARASGDDLADVVKVTSQTIDAFNLRVENDAGQMKKNSRDVANAIASSADRTASSFKDTGIAMSYVASSAKTVGWDVEQTAAAVGELSNRGIEGSQAGTGLRKVILSLIQPTKNAQGALKEAGLSMDDFKTKSGKLKDVDQIFKLINQHTHSWGKARKATFFKALFGTTGVAAGEALAQSAGGVKKLDDDLTQLIHNIKKDEKNNYVGELAEKNMKSAQMQIERVKRTAQAFELSIGSALLPAVNKVGTAIAKWAVSKEGTRSMKEFSGAAGSLADHIANHTKDIISFTKGVLDGVKDTYHFIKPIATTVGRIAGFFNKSSKGSQSTAKNLGKIVGIFGTAAISLKVVKTLFGGVFAISKDTAKSAFTFVNWIRGGSKAQRGLNAQLKETNRLLEKSIALQRQYNSQIKKDDFSSKGNSSSNVADDISDAVDMADDLKGGKAKDGKVIGDIAKDAEKEGAKSAHFWQRGWLGKLGGFNKRLFAKLNPRNWTSTFARLGDKAGQGFHLHLFKHIKGIGSKVKNAFKPRSWTQTFANLGDKAGSKFVKATSTRLVNSRGKVKFKALFKYGSQAAEEAGGTAGMGWMRRLVMHIGNGRSKFHTGIKGLFGIATDTAEASGVSGATGFLGKFAGKLKAGAGYLGAAWEVASIGIDIVKGIRSHNPDQRIRSYGGAVGGVFGAAAGAMIGGPGGAVIGAGIGQAIGHSLPEIKKWGDKAASAFGKGWHNSMKWLGQLMTGDMKGVTKGWNNFWGGMGDWFDQTFGVDNGKHHKAKKPKKKPTVTQKIIKTGVHVSKKDVANVKAMSKALKDYAGSLAKVKTQLNKNDPSGELNKVNNFLKSHTKQWTDAAGPIKKIGDAFKYLSKFANSVAKKDAFAAFNKDLPKLDNTLNKHGNSIKKGIEKITNALKAGGGKKGKGKTLLSEFKDLTSGIKDLTSKVKSLNSNLGKTASDFKAIGKVTKEFKSEKSNPLTRMAKGFDKLTKALKDDTKKISDNVKKINSAFQGKKGKKNFAEIVKDSVKPLNSMADDFKSMAKNMPKVSGGIKSMAKNIKTLTKGKTSPIAKLGKEFDSLKTKLKNDAKTITDKIQAISSALGGKKGFNARIKYSASKSKDFSSQLKSLASSSKSFAESLKSAISSLKTFASKKKGINSVSGSIRSLYKTITNYPFGKKIASQAKTAASGLTGKGNFASKLSSAAKSVKTSVSSMNSKFSSFVKSFKGAASSLVSGKSSITSTFTSLKSDVKSTFHSMWKDVASDTQDGLNGIVDEINDAVDDINDAISSIADNDGKHKAKHAKTVHLAEGTDHISKPTLAVLNDGSDSPGTDNREGLLHSNGVLEYLSGRNIMRMLLPGDAVIKASDMAKLPHYASGTANKLFNFNEQIKASKRLLQAVKLQTKAEEQRNRERLQEKKLEAKTRLQYERAANSARSQQIRGQQRILKLQQELISGHKASRSSTSAYRRKKTAASNEALIWRKQNAEKGHKISTKNYKANSNSYKLQVLEAKKKSKKSDPYWVAGDKFNKASGLPKSLRKLVDQGFAEARRANAREKAREAHMPKIYRKFSKGQDIQIPRKNLDFSGKTVYLDSGYFTKSGKLTGKIVAVSKSWLKAYDKKQTKILRELGKKRKKKTTRRRSSSSSSRSWHWRTSKSGTRYRDYYTPVKHRSRRRSSSISSASSRVRSTTSSAASRVSASVSGASSIKSLSSLINKVKGTHKASVKVTYSGTYKAKKSIERLISSISSLNKKKIKKLSISYAGTYKAKRSLSWLIDEIKKYNKAKLKKLKLDYSGTYKAKRSIGWLIDKIKDLNKTKPKKIKVSYSGTYKAWKSFDRLIDKIHTLNFTKIKEIRVKYSGTYKAKMSIARLITEIKKLNKTKIRSLKVRYFGTYKAKKSIERLIKSIKKLNRTKPKKIKVNYSGVSSARKAISKLAKSLKTVSKDISSLTKKSKKNEFGKVISKQAEEAVKTLKNKGNFAKQFNQMTVKFKKDLTSLEKAGKSDFKSMFSTMEKTQKSHVKGMENNISHFKRSFSRDMSSLETGIKHSFRSFWKVIANDASSGMHNVITVLNEAIDKVNTVIARFGGNGKAVKKVSASFKRFATGTGVFNNQRRAITKPTLAVLNDGSDSPETNNEETIWDTRTNEFGVVKGRNVPTLLEPGQEVLNASESKTLGFTHFATGTGALKQLYELAKKYWKNPVKTSEAMFGTIKGLKGAINTIANGAKNKGEKQATAWWSQLWKMVENKVNDGDLGPASGLLKAVEKLGENKHYSQGQRMSKFFADCSSLVSRALASTYGAKWATPNGWALTVKGLWQHAHEIPRSEAKPGDPVFWLPDEHVGVYAGHGKYYSAYGPNPGGPVGMQSVAPGATFGRFNGLDTSGSKDSKDVKVKANGKLQKQIRSQVGKGFWSTIQKIADKYGDNGMAGAFKLGGDIAQRVKALAKGLKSADPRATKNGIAAIVGNAITESTLNPSVVNGIGAAGLWQFLGPRRAGLNSYASRHGMSWKNPATQINYALNADGSKALFKSILESHDSVAKLARIFSQRWEVGGHDDAHVQGALSAAKILGYANGGIAHKASIFGEAGPEMAIPLTETKSARAWELVGKTIAILSKKSGLDTQINTKEQKEEDEWRKEVLLILRLLLSRDKDIDVKFDIDGRKVFEGIKRYINENNRRATMYQRRGLSGHY